MFERLFENRFQADVLVCILGYYGNSRTRTTTSTRTISYPAPFHTGSERPGFARTALHSQLKNRCRASGGIFARSTRVKKSIVLNCRSSAGGPQIFAPNVK